LAHEVKVAGSQDEAVRLTVDAGTDLRTSVVLDRNIQIESCVDPSAVAVTAIDEQHLRLDASPTCAGVLMLSDNWYPGWHATLDGRPIDVLRADAAIRAVAVPAGTHRVELLYRPDGLRWTAALSLATLGVVLVAALWPARAVS
jgi:uncharacterized membrane protein YfhO